MSSRRCDLTSPSSLTFRFLVFLAELVLLLSTLAFSDLTSDLVFSDLTSDLVWSGLLLYTVGRSRRHLLEAYSLQRERVFIFR
jgi:hypothetical protein